MLRRRLLALACTLLAAPAAAEKPFDLLEVPAPGRTAAADFADLDGDGRTDVFVVSLFGVPPRERRQLRVHFQRPDGSLPDTPDWTGDVLDGAAAWDRLTMPGTRRDEILLLRKDRVTALSFAGRELTRRELMIPGDPTVATTPDERGLDRLRIARPGLDGTPLLLVPALGRCVVLATDGRVLGVLETGDRANYFIPPRPGAIIGESEIEQYYDYPRIDTGDVDGDGRLDVLATSRHEVRAFLQREDGTFGAQPAPLLEIGRITEEDQIRGTGNVRAAPADVDGDGRVDLLLTYTTGGLRSAESATTVHLNRGGTWDLEEPDQTFETSGGWTTVLLRDLEGDGSVEFVQGRIPLSVLEIVEVLLTESIDMEMTIRRRGKDGLFERRPWYRSKLDIGVNFEAFDTRGFPPSIEADLNGDGFVDVFSSGSGKAVEFFPGGGDQPFKNRAASQKLDTGGALRFGDLDADGLTDWLIYDRTRPDTPLRIGRNRGSLPGTAPGIRAPSDR